MAHGSDQQQQQANGSSSGGGGDREDPYIVFGYGSLIFRVRSIIYHPLGGRVSYYDNGQRTNEIPGPFVFLPWTESTTDGWGRTQSDSCDDYCSHRLTSSKTVTQLFFFPSPGFFFAWAPLPVLMILWLL